MYLNCRLKADTIMYVRLDWGGGRKILLVSCKSINEAWLSYQLNCFVASLDIEAKERDE